MTGFTTLSKTSSRRQAISNGNYGNYISGTIEITRNRRWRWGYCGLVTAVIGARGTTWVRLFSCLPCAFSSAPLLSILSLDGVLTTSIGVGQRKLWRMRASDRIRRKKRWKEQSWPQIIYLRCKCPEKVWRWQSTPRSSQRNQGGDSVRHKWSCAIVEWEGCISYD